MQAFGLAREEEQEEEEEQQEPVHEEEEPEDEGEEDEDDEDDEEFESLQALMELVCADDDGAPADGPAPSSAVDAELSEGFLLKRAPPAAVEEADARTFVAAQERPFREVILQVSVRRTPTLTCTSFRARPLTHGGAACSREG